MDDMSAQVPLRKGIEKTVAYFKQELQRSSHNASKVETDVPTHNYIEKQPQLLPAD